MAYQILQPVNLFGTVLVRGTRLTASQEARLGAQYLRGYLQNGDLAVVEGPPAPEPHTVAADAIPTIEESGQAYEVAIHGLDLHGQRWPEGTRLTAKQRNGLLRQDVPDPRFPLSAEGLPRMESLLARMVRDGKLREVPGPCAHRAAQVPLPRLGPVFGVPRRAAPEPALPASPPAPLADAASGIAPASPTNGSGTILSRTLALLAEKGEMHGDAILAALGPEAKKSTVVNALDRAMRAGKLRKVRPATYALA